MRLTKELRWRIGFVRVALAQVSTGRPPEARATFERLTHDGVSTWRAYLLLAAAYEAEVASMLTEGRVYDHQHYVRLLDALPVRPDRSLRDAP